MPSDSIAPLRDIRQHIELAQAFVVGMEITAFLRDLRTQFAVTRCLEIISEASRRLPASFKDSHPSIPWKRMAAAGNVYRHEYEDVAAQFVWATVQNELPPLKALIEEELRRLGERG